MIDNKNGLNEFREIFSLIDRDGGGTIAKEELGELLEIIGVEATEDELNSMMNQVDSDKSGEIDFDGESVLDDLFKLVYLYVIVVSRLNLLHVDMSMLLSTLLVSMSWPFSNDSVVLYSS